VQQCVTRHCLPKSKEDDCTSSDLSDFRDAVAEAEFVHFVVYVQLNDAMRCDRGD